MGYFASSVLNTCSSVWLWGGWTGVTAHWDPQRCVEGKSGVTVHLDPKVTLDMCGLSTPWVEGDLSPGPKVTLGVGVLSTPWVGESSVTFYWDPRSTWICHVWYSLPDIWGGWHDLSPGPNVSLDVLNVRCPLAEMCGGATSVFDFSQCGQFGFCLFWKY